MKIFNFRRVTAAFARLHCLDLDKVQLIDRQGRPATVSRKPIFIDWLKQLHALVPEPENILDPTKRKRYIINMVRINWHYINNKLN